MYYLVELFAANVSVIDLVMLAYVTKNNFLKPKQIFLFS
jgi:hypothetical protein